MRKGSARCQRSVDTTGLPDFFRRAVSEACSEVSRQDLARSGWQILPIADFRLVPASRWKTAAIGPGAARPFA